MDALNVKQTSKITLVVTTYNQPRYLAFVLKTALEQERLPDELVVADDGSRQETEDVVRAVAATSPIPIVHVWQEDVGFRLNRSRNNALAVASGDLVLMIDGDCFLNSHYVADCLYYAKRNRFIAGTRVHIDRKLRETLLTSQQTRVGFFTRGVSKKFNAIRSRALSRLCSHEQPAPEKAFDASLPLNGRGGMAGANLAFWRDDALCVNGFNEVVLGYGGNDREFGARLERAGVVRFRMVHHGIVYHFKHDRPYAKDFHERIDSTSPEYLESLDDVLFRCRDAFGLTRATSERKPPVVEAGRYRKFVF